MKSWCIKCRKEQELDHTKEIIHNSREAVSGKCSKCKTDVIVYSKGEIE